MRAIIQRVNSASITIESEIPKKMSKGLVVLFAASKDDIRDATPALVEKLAAKTANLRIFNDDNDRMNLSAIELGLSIMVVSQFTLFADTRKGNRPSFIEAANSPDARRIYDLYVQKLREYPFREFITGSFGAKMNVELENNGPVTIIIDTKEWENHS